MDKNYEYILDLILNIMDENPQIDTDALIEQQKEALGLNEEIIKKIKSAFHCLDKFDEKQQSLENAKKEGVSRTEWLLNDISEMSKREGLSEEDRDELIEQLQIGVSDQESK